MNQNIKHISCECKCKFDGRKCSSNQIWNNDKYQCECKNPEKKHIWNPATCTCENDKYSGSIIDNSVITCDRIIEATKTVPTKSTSTDIYILLVIWLITIVLLIAVSISCYLIKYRSK